MQIRTISFKYGTSNKTKDAKNNAFAGVGRPIKPEFCLSSTLNLARRSAEKTGINKATTL